MKKYLILLLLALPFISDAQTRKFDVSYSSGRKVSYERDTISLSRIEGDTLWVSLFLQVIAIPKKIFENTNTVKQYNRSGIITSPTKIFSDTFALTTGNGQVLDISAAGFTKVTSVQVNAQYSTATAATMPIVELKDYTNSTVTINVVQSNTVTVGILGVNVTGLQFLQSMPNTKIHLTAIGY